MSGTGRVAAVLLAVAVLLGAVVVAAGGETPVGSRGARQPSEWVLDVAVSLLLVQMAFGAVLCVVLLVLRPQEVFDPSTAVRKRGRVVVAVTIVVLLVLFVFTVRRFAGDPGGFDSGIFGGSSSTGGLGEVTDRYEPRFATVPVLVVLTLLAVAVGGWFVAHRTRRGMAGADETLQAALEEALEDSLDDLRAESDPRRAVIAAYARLERVLGAHGVSRHASEAPEEYLRRVLSSLELSRRAVSRLTTLFQTAKFSHHDVDAGMKDEAIDALVSARDELRAAREGAEAERSAALERGAGQVGA